jgi:hypothetical protein
MAEEAHAAILSVLERYPIGPVNDAGCGDKGWIPSIEDCENYDLRYGFDITLDKMRPCDLIICRDVMIHMRAELVLEALKLFNSKYLLATTSDMNRNIYTDSAYDRDADLSAEPFNLSEIERFPDGNKYLGLYAL